MEYEHSYGMYSSEGDIAVRRLLEPHLARVRAHDVSPREAYDLAQIELITALREYYPEVTDSVVMRAVWDEIHTAA